MLNKLKSGQLFDQRLNIRPAFLIQPIDYGETSHNDTKTRYILQCIKYNFPNLIHSFQYENYQGIIISKSNYNGVHDIDNTAIGQILGYPCYLEFDNLDRNNETYAITVMVKLNDGNEIDVFSNVCKDLTYLNMFEKIAQKSNASSGEDALMIRQMQRKETVLYWRSSNTVQPTILYYSTIVLQHCTQYKYLYSRSTVSRSTKVLH